MYSSHMVREKSSISVETQELIVIVLSHAPKTDELFRKILG